MSRLSLSSLAGLVCLVLAPGRACAGSDALARAEAALVDLLCKGLARELQARMRPGHHEKTPPGVLSKKVTEALGADPDLLEALDEGARRHRFADRVARRAERRCPAAMRGLQPPLVLVEYLLELRQKGGRAIANLQVLGSQPDLGKGFARKASKVLYGRSKELRRCYERVILRLPAEKRRRAVAQIALSISLSKDGELSAVRMLRSTGRADLDACIMKGLAGLRFDPPESATVLEIRMDFHPPGGPAPVKTP
ncbi:MAG: energy transducer TonB [Deltaproteobacteria bacterium]|nr:energy transducer TonB [Deltaproteobacteria bacterium]